MMSTSGWQDDVDVWIAGVCIVGVRKVESNNSDLLWLLNMLKIHLDVRQYIILDDAEV